MQQRRNPYLILNGWAEYFCLAQFENLGELVKNTIFVA